MSKEPQEPHWKAGLDRARIAPKCGARTRSAGACGQPGMKNGRCRYHGGKSTGPRTPEGRERSRMANWKHGRRSAAFIAERRETAASVRLLRKIIAAL